LVDTKDEVMKVPRVSVVTVPLDHVSFAILKNVQTEMNFNTQSEALQHILTRYWKGFGSSIGHPNWPLTQLVEAKK
jgi:hypothetical protein